MPGPADQIIFSHIGQWADHNEFAIVTGEFGRHALEFAAEKHVQEKGLQHVVAVVAQRDFVAAQAARHAVENAPAQARTQAASGFALGDFGFDDAVGVLRFNMERHARLREIGGQYFFGKTGLLLVQIDGHQLKWHGRALAQFHQNIEQAVAVFAA